MVRANRSELPTDTATVRIVSDTGLTRATVMVYVADSPGERYVGLSRTESLADTRGMLFVYAEADTRTFVMRNMSFPIDMLFFNSKGQLRRIHRASVKADNKKHYRGWAQWVLEVNRGWSKRHNVQPGDRIVATNASRQ